MDKLNRPLRKVLRKILTAIPYVLLLVSAFSGYFSSAVWYKHFRNTYLGDLSGYSVVTGLFMFLTFYREKHDYCLHTRLATVVLVLMNVVVMIYKENDVHYNHMYDFYIGMFVCLVTVFVVYDFGGRIKRIFNRSNK